MMQHLSLQDYTIYIGNDWKALNDFVQQQNYASIFVLVDENTHKACLPLLKANLKTSFQEIQIPAGEIHKNISSCTTIWTSLMEQKASRNALFINLGGGVIGDMGGFCASTFKRGMDFIQIPTTLLSQVDASIGGKLGIDFQQIKNSIGLFKNPKGVWINPDFLKTLPYSELRSGYAEIIKHSLIADKEQWDKLSQVSDLTSFNNWADLIVPSLKIKQSIVEQDPFEKGIRKALNFGHTIGHAVEGWALETDHPLLHGEAIAIGMICESYLSHKILGLSREELDQISNYMLHIYGNYTIPFSIVDELVDLMRNDKKNIGAAINFTLLDQIGNCQINQTADRNLIKESLQFYQSF